MERGGTARHGTARLGTAGKERGCIGTEGNGVSGGRKVAPNRSFTRSHRGAVTLESAPFNSVYWNTFSMWGSTWQHAAGLIHVFILMRTWNVSRWQDWFVSQVFGSTGSERSEFSSTRLFPTFTSSNEQSQVLTCETPALENCGFSFLWFLLAFTPSPLTAAKSHPERRRKVADPWAENSEETESVGVKPRRGGRRSFFTSRQSDSDDEDEEAGALKCPSSSGGGGADCGASVQPGRGKCAPGSSLRPLRFLRHPPNFNPPQLSFIPLWIPNKHTPPPPTDF